uniref:Transmembrane protein n=1 Tax=Globisporangium ultimum (strain ATCC 200006 / CBS 805.95 / DAOM BR144) TaxID=431595 RepID=K3WCI7_GLOUD
MTQLAGALFNCLICGFLLFLVLFQSLCWDGSALLSLMLLPRLKMALFAFWSSGCEFEGQQLPISETWFLIYPSIIEVLIFYYSVLNWIGKLFRYRRSFLIKAEDWEYVTLMAPLRNVVHLWNHRVKVFELYETTLNDGNGHVLSLATEPMLCRFDDPRFDQIKWWQIRAQQIA